MTNVFSTLGQVFLYVAQHPDSRVRDIATYLNVTDRTVILALSQLTEMGLIRVHRQGRRNSYKIVSHGKIHVGTTTIRSRDLLALFNVSSSH